MSCRRGSAPMPALDTQSSEPQQHTHRIFSPRAEQCVVRLSPQFAPPAQRAPSGCPREELLSHWPAVVRACRPLVQSREEAEDCAAEALLAALETPQRALDNPEAWMVTVARRRAYDAGRRRARDQRRMAGLASQSVLVDIDEPGAVVTDRAEAAWLAAVARRELPTSTQAVLSQLASGAGVQDAATELRLTRRAVESHLRRARLALRSAMAATLGLAAALLAPFRRSLPLAAPASAVALVLVLLPQAAPSGPTPGDTSAPPVTRSVVGVSAGTTAQPVAVPSAVSLPAEPPELTSVPSNAAATGASGGASPVSRVVPEVRATTPAGRTAVTREERVGPDDAVGIAVHCLRELTVSATHVGC